jgi:hypothetical protein
MVRQQASLRWRKATGWIYVRDGKGREPTDSVAGEPIEDHVTAKADMVPEPAPSWARALVASLAPKNCTRARTLLPGDDNSPRRLVFS